jgi:hypothetical protein
MLYVTAIAIATTIYYNRHVTHPKYTYALNLAYVYGHCHVYIHTYMRYNKTIEATDGGRHDSKRGEHSGRGPH